jgi:hypothetical protein
MYFLRFLTDTDRKLYTLFFVQVLQCQIWFNNIVKLQPGRPQRHRKTQDKMDRGRGLTPFFNRNSGGWSPTGSIRHCGHQQAYCANPGWLWWWRKWWIEIWQGKPKYSEKTCPNVTLSTTNPHMLCRDRNPSRYGGKPATNRLSYGTAYA